MIIISQIVIGVFITLVGYLTTVEVRQFLKDNKKHDKNY